MNETIVGLLVLIELQILTVGVAYALRKKKNLGDRPVFIDTSVLIDGRILTIAQTGFIPSRMIIPKSVLAELQLLADGSDSDKRARARHGLDVASALRELDGVRVDILADGQATQGVDERLLELAKKYNGAICTIDYNLNKVAQAEKISVLNINELAQQVRMGYLPGEKVSLLIAQKGNDAQQGVGYLADGTMVVVEHAKADIGKTIEIEFIRTIQTAAGRMLFAKKIHSDKDKASKKKPTRAKQAGPEDRLVSLANQ
jgi:uncharacterized protein YacL